MVQNSDYFFFKQFKNIKLQMLKLWFTPSLIALHLIGNRNSRNEATYISLNMPYIYYSASFLLAWHIRNITKLVNFWCNYHHSNYIGRDSRWCFEGSFPYCSQMIISARLNYRFVDFATVQLVSARKSDIIKLNCHRDYHVTFKRNRNGLWGSTRPRSFWIWDRNIQWLLYNLIKI